ncbi:protein PIGMENT DEFECTIVE 338, chloroplastic isoform X2 [Jatropha curcas]|uniref:protein PIGMENT DEFECTIVE 338, chloroplastic isoform X2 n=1 Tax=Jatropha curcas TaxID=180498 RepID=UPI0009D761B9|nr:protein PIGMENT DEFECTIVE 338, chloroplastic isoform X2 [Jatropha curcas]
MLILLQPCKSPSLLFTCNNKLLKSSSFHFFPTIGSLKKPSFSKNFSLRRSTHVSFCSQNDNFNDFSNTQLTEKLQNDRIQGNEELELLNKPSPVVDSGLGVEIDKESSIQFTEKLQNDRIQENEELELLNKPSPVVIDNGLGVEIDKESKGSEKDEALAPFLKFFKPRNSLEVKKEEEDGLGVLDGKNNVNNEDKEGKKVNVDYYEPKPGDFVVGVVVSGNENKLDVNVGADLLGTMLTKEVLPLYDREMEYLLCDVKKDAEGFMVQGKMGIVKDEATVSGGTGPGRPVVETGTILFAEVLGRTLSGRPLLSTRRLFRRIAWHRLSQIKELNEPIEVKITEWNTGGLLTRIEGLRAFLPKAELMNRVKNFKELKENVGRRMYVLITRINETNNDLILSEREAWEMLNLREGTLHEGTVKKIFPYGAQVRIGDTNRSGLLHISNITRTRVTAVSDVLEIDEKVKVLVVKSMFPDKIALSIADLESEPGLFISNKEKVFAEAEEMAKKYRQMLPVVLATRKSGSTLSNALPFDSEEIMYANWKWFKFERD